MRTDRITSSALAILAVVLTTISVLDLRDHQAVVHAAPSPRQRWEYKTITRGFHWENGEWSGLSFWDEDGTTLTLPESNGATPAIRAKLKELGEEGWELVSVTPYSSLNRTNTKFSEGNIISSASSSGNSMNGMTTIDRWVFKRPKP